MNKLVIIGNGFDLAHGLETRYNDFILWYINKVLPSIITKPSFEDQLIITSNTYPRIMYSRIETIQEFRNLFKKPTDLSITYKNTFFKSLIMQCGRSNWVDIESHYYSELLSLYRKLELTNKDQSDYISTLLKKLNDCFEAIKQQLIEYLQTIKIDKVKLNEDIRNHFLNLTDNNKKAIGTEILFLTFNYTNTLEAYTELFESGFYEINYIHGKLNDENNPVIFGYGDEMDSFYEKIERLNSNEFLRFIKSFGYFKTNNYQKFSRFIDSGYFTVHIMGHSCGLSDRILLNSIFEHENCKQIIIYYHKKINLETDYFEKTQEISRHFKASGKANMRKIIVPFADSKPLSN